MALLHNQRTSTEFISPLRGEVGAKRRARGLELSTASGCPAIDFAT